MSVHHLQLATEPFSAILGGRKTIGSRLYDEKRKLIKPGDTILFTNREHAEQTVQAQAINLLKYDSFHELFAHNDPAKFGGPSLVWLDDQIREIYSPDVEAKYGVVGIEFECIKKRPS